MSRDDFRRVVVDRKQSVAVAVHMIDGSHRSLAITVSRSTVKGFRCGEFGHYRSERPSSVGGRGGDFLVFLYSDK